MAKMITAGAFPQRIRTFYGDDKGISGEVIALGMSSDGAVFAALPDGLSVLKDGFFTKISDKKVNLFYKTAEGILYIVSGSELLKTDGDSLSFVRDFGEAIAGLAEDDNRLWLATSSRLYRFDGSDFVHYSNNDDFDMCLLTAFGNERVYESDGHILTGLWGKRPRWGLIAPETSDMPDCSISAIAADGFGGLWLGTDKGAVIYDGRSAWFTSDDFDFLPKEPVTALCLSDDGKVFIGTEIGLYIIDGARRSFLTAGRWLPDAAVTAVMPDGKGGAWVGTKNGISHLEIKQMTLAEKAAHFEAVAEKYHMREGYFTGRALSEFCNMESGAPWITDNDGLWTGSFIVAEACRYAATGDPDALNKARTSCKALLKLTKITGIPGFPARAYRRPGEPGFGDGDPEWHLTSDEKGELEWKGETSSDETSGHFFGLTYYYDLCADESEKAEIAATAAAIVDHILEHDYTVCDIDGLPTTWGRWTPESLNRDDMWRWERGINSLEMLTMLKVAYKMTGDEKYNDEYKRLIACEKFALNSAKHKMDDNHSNHIDDHLGFLVMATILRYEDNPRLRGYLLNGLRHHWEYERVERCPFWNIVYGAFSGECCDLDRAVTSLQELPLDFVNYPIKNSVRDLEWDDGPTVFGDPPQLFDPLPYDEKPVNNFDGNPFAADGGDGTWAAEPTIFLLPYWLGRLYGLLGD